MELKILKDRRIEMKLSQRRLAEAAGVAFATVQRAEMTGQINVDTLMKIAAVLGLSVEIS